MRSRSLVVSCDHRLQLEVIFHPMKWTQFFDKRFCEERWTVLIPGGQKKTLSRFQIPPRFHHCNLICLKYRDFPSSATFWGPRSCEVAIIWPATWDWGTTFCSSEISLQMRFLLGFRMPSGIDPDTNIPQFSTKSSVLCLVYLVFTRHLPFFNWKWSWTAMTETFREALSRLVKQTWLDARWSPREIQGAWSWKRGTGVQLYSEDSQFGMDLCWYLI